LVIDAAPLMDHPLFDKYRARVAKGELKLDAAQDAAAQRLEALDEALKHYRPGRRSWFGPRRVPRGIYLWGDVGRGKSMLMDMFFACAPTAPKRRVHFNAFMMDTHARIHAWRNLDPRVRSKRPEYVADAGDDPIPPVARAIAREAALLCFDELQVNDVADAMILGRLFAQLFDNGTVIVATSNTRPKRLYEGGLNRQLFLPFIALIEDRLDVVEIDGPQDYRLARIAALNRYIAPLGPQADAAMDEAWALVTGCRSGEPETLRLLGRELIVPAACAGAARFSFDALCLKPLAAPDYLALARRYEMLFVDRVPVMTPEMRDAARRLTLLIDTLYDESINFVCSAAAPPDALYVDGDGADAFRRTASRLVEMQSTDYAARARARRTSATEPAGAVP
jgi:cell division protein ZapE